MLASRHHVRRRHSNLRRGDSLGDGSGVSHSQRNLCLYKILAGWPGYCLGDGSPVLVRLGANFCHGDDQRSPPSKLLESGARMARSNLLLLGSLRSGRAQPLSGRRKYQELHISGDSIMFAPFESWSWSSWHAIKVYGWIETIGGGIKLAFIFAVTIILYTVSASGTHASWFSTWRLRLRESVLVV